MRWALACSLLMIAACGSSSGGAGPSDDAPINTLGADGKAEICDWVAMQWGGYGVVVQCGPGSTISGPESQSACLMKSFPNCTAKLGDVKACVAAIAKAKCEVTKGNVPPECSKLPPGCFTQG